MTMDESRYPKKMLRASVPGGRTRGYQRKTWMEVIEDAIKARGQDVEEAKTRVYYREKWRRMYRLSVD